MEPENKRRRVHSNELSASNEDTHGTLNLQVSLPSGRCETFSVLKSGIVADLKTSVQRSFGQRFLRLAAPDGHLLDATESIELSGLQDGDSITAIAQQPKIAATQSAFALWCEGAGRIVTWGSAYFGGDSSAVQDQLKNVQHIYATREAFAAILAEGSVVTWGNGGDSSEVQDQLKDVKQIAATDVAFAAILADGNVVTWGEPLCGGDSSAVQDQLRHAQQIAATGGAFAAILADGSVVTWGEPDFGGDSSEVQNQLKNVQQIAATGGAFAAILGNGSVLTWGTPECGGDSSEVQDQLKNVKQISATTSSCNDVFVFGAFAAILADADGSVVTWGHCDIVCGGDSSEVKDQLRKVKQIAATDSAFAAILANRRVVTWGDPNFGGDSAEVQDELRNVQQIAATKGAFAAVLADGNVVTWGDDSDFDAGDSTAVQDQLRNVKQICASRRAFAAILADGSVVTWGYPGWGGDSSAVQDRFKYM